MHKFLLKIESPIEDQLRAAIESDSVLDVYTPFEAKKENESQEEFVVRVRNEASRYQFVSVKFNDSFYYVAFDFSGPLVSQYGKFQVVPAQVVGGIWGVHYCIFYPSLSSTLKQQEIFARIDSGCLSGMIMGDITCDCKNQLEESIKKIAQQGSGMIFEIPGQDGRGWHQYKMANQYLMNELEMNTVEAARAFYKKEEYIDRRSYHECAIILRALGFNENHSFSLGTNNPSKTKAFQRFGFNLKRVETVVAKELSVYATKNLNAKQKEWNHETGFKPEGTNRDRGAIGDRERNSRQVARAAVGDYVL